MNSGALTLKMGHPAHAPSPRPFPPPYFIRVAPPPLLTRTYQVPVDVAVKNVQSRVVGHKSKYQVAVCLHIHRITQRGLGVEGLAGVRSIVGLSSCHDPVWAGRSTQLEGFKSKYIRYPNIFGANAASTCMPKNLGGPAMPKARWRTS